MAILIDNKKASFNYEILDTFKAGVVLFGHEVKTIKGKRGSLRGAFVSIVGEEIFLKSADIPPYQVNNTPKEYNPTRDRKLLLTKNEISKLIGKQKEKGLTLIPLQLYNDNRHIKVEVALVRGKKKHDKRQVIKKRESDRDIHRTLKSQR